MDDSILKKQGANFYGFESIDDLGKHHYHPFAIRGNGDFMLTKNEVIFKPWLSSKKYTIPLHTITRVEIKAGHNLKMKWPAKVLRIHYIDGKDTQIFGIALGGTLSLTKGWQDNGYVWKEKIESLMKE